MEKEKGFFNQKYVRITVKNLYFGKFGIKIWKKRAIYLVV